MAALEVARHHLRVVHRLHRLRVGLRRLRAGGILTHLAVRVAKVLLTHLAVRVAKVLRLPRSLVLQQANLRLRPLQKVQVEVNIHQAKLLHRRLLSNRLLLLRVIMEANIHQQQLRQVHQQRRLLLRRASNIRQVVRRHQLVRRLALSPMMATAESQVVADLTML